MPSSEIRGTTACDHAWIAKTQTVGQTKSTTHGTLCAVVYEKYSRWRHRNTMICL